MQDIWTETLAILIASLAIAALASVFILFRPAALRRRRHRRSSHRPKIDLLKHPKTGSEPPVDA
jgi:hypothetical protein